MCTDQCPSQVVRVPLAHNLNSAFGRLLGLWTAMKVFTWKVHVPLLLHLVLANACFTQVVTDNSTCTGQGLSPITSKGECQQAIDFVNSVEDVALRPGGPVAEVDYGFRTPGCYTSCIGTHLDKSGHPHYFCSGFNSNNKSKHGAEPRSRIVVYCKTSRCCTCTNGFPEFAEEFGCPQEVCRICRGSHIHLFGKCWNSFMIHAASCALVSGGMMGLYRILSKFFLTDEPRKQSGRKSA